MRAAIFSVAVAAALTSGERDADACSCVPWALAHPWPDSTDVPRSTIILLSAGGSEAPILRRTDNREPVAMEIEERRYANYYGPVWYGRPAQLLDSGVSYEICGRVDEVESCIPGFTVGDTIDDESPVIPPPTALHAQRLRNIDGACGASCWGSPSDALILDHAPASEAGFAVVEVRREKYEQLSWSFLQPMQATDERTEVFNGYCGPSNISLEEGVVYCSRMIALDGSGNLSAATSEMCGAAATCQTEHCEADFDGSCPALAAPDAGPTEPATDQAGGGCAAAGSGDPLGPLILLLVGGLLRRAQGVERRSTWPRQPGGRSR